MRRKGLRSLDGSALLPPCFSTFCLDSKAGRFLSKEMHLIEVYGEINLLVDPDRRLDIHYSHEVVFSRCDVEINSDPRGSITSTVA